MDAPSFNNKFPFFTSQIPADFSKLRYTVPLPFSPVTNILYSAWPLGPLYLTEYPKNSKRLCFKGPIVDKFDSKLVGFALCAKNV
jgi:hypothetical protein